MAMAISTRCRMPPDSSCGYCLARSSAGVRPTRVEQLEHARVDRLAVAAPVDLQHLGDLRADGAHRVERAAGVLRDQADHARRGWRRAASAASRRCRCRSAGWRRARPGRCSASSPSTACAVVVLPEPDSPTSATTSPGSTLKRHAVDDLLVAVARPCRRSPRSSISSNGLGHGAVLPERLADAVGRQHDQDDDEAGHRGQPPGASTM